MKRAIELVKKMLKENKHDHLQSILETIHTEATLEYVLKRLEEELYSEPSTIFKCNCVTFKDAFVELEILQDNLFISCSNKTGNSYNKVMLSYEDIEKLKQFLNEWDS